MTKTAWRSVCGEHKRCGCQYGAVCCLGCPLAECVYVDEGQKPLSIKYARVRELRASGVGVRMIMGLTGLAKSTVYNVLRAG